MTTLKAYILILTLIVLFIGCSKKSDESNPVEAKANEPKTKLVMVSLDTVPFTPLPNKGLFVDLSIPPDTDTVASLMEIVQAESGKAGYQKIDTLKILEATGYTKQLDSLKKLKESADKRFTELNDSLERVVSERSQLQSELNYKVETEDSLTILRINKIAKLVDNMRASEAALLLDKLPPKLAAYVVTKVKDRQAGKVLAALSPTKSSQLTMMIKTGEYLTRDDKGSFSPEMVKRAEQTANVAAKKKTGPKSAAKQDTTSAKQQ
jgi:flagellar motility protein MotE (MotC chaperone)